MTGLHLAAYFGVDDAVRDLLGSNSPDFKDSHGRTPLSYAAENGHNGIVKLLLEYKVDADSKDDKRKHGRAKNLNGSPLNPATTWHVQMRETSHSSD